MPRVAIVTPCYNAEKFVLDMVESVRDQTFSDWIHVVVNDGSTDLSATILQRASLEDPRLIVIPQVNAGMAAARNVGIEHVRDVEYALFLDADDRLLPDALATMVATLDEHQSTAGAVGQAVIIDETGARLAEVSSDFNYRVVGSVVKRVPSSSRLDFFDIIPINPISTPGQVLLRNALLGDLKFDQDVAGCADWDMWLALSMSTAFVVIRTAVLEYRQHSDSASRNYQVMRNQRQAVYRKHLGDPALTDDFRRAIVTAYPFGMYQFDSRMCRQWALDSARKGRMLDAASYGVRSVRYRLKALRAPRELSG